MRLKRKGEMSEEERKATESTQGLIEVVSKHDLDSNIAAERREKDRQAYAKHREWFFSFREEEEDEEDQMDWDSFGVL